MNEFQEFKNYLQQNENIFRAWGEFVAEKIQKKLPLQISPLKIHEFLKIEAKPRVKDINSALAKIGRKNYTNPSKEMTDLVGVRFVVLIAEQINTISSIIENETEWDALLSKDFEKDKSDNPNVFDYQSKHYEVRPKKPITVKFEGEEIIIPQEICCEVQVRSLLQHAYAELVHDNLYKSKGSVPNKAKREVAKSMALMETTDDLFNQTLKILHQHNEPIECLYENLSKFYIDNISSESNFDRKTNLIILADFSDLIESDTDTIEKIKDLFNTKTYIKNKITSRVKDYYLFQQPIILFIYWVVSTNHARITINNWPLPAYQRELNYIFTDLDKGSIL
ncbi:GTP pyrophosphokinase [Snodgrassella communis]|uniref:GTP pyrophosphokinase n=1 Tax=Snodgrassella communis TaxID=2946699 RepID=UPI000C1F74ED|nr:RelA/SpoT domain-containing protein [Snodgrassella communis]